MKRHSCKKISNSIPFVVDYVNNNNKWDCMLRENLKRHTFGDKHE